MLCPALRVADTVKVLSFGTCCGMWAYHQVPVATATGVPCQTGSSSSSVCQLGKHRVLLWCEDSWKAQGLHWQGRRSLCGAAQQPGPLLRPGCATCVHQLLQPFAMSLYNTQEYFTSCFNALPSGVLSPWSTPSLHWQVKQRGSMVFLPNARAQ